MQKRSQRIYSNTCRLRARADLCVRRKRILRCAKAPTRGQSVVVKIVLSETYKTPSGVAAKGTGPLDSYLDFPVGQPVAAGIRGPRTLSRKIRKIRLRLLIVG